MSDREADSPMSHESSDNDKPANLNYWVGVSEEGKPNIFRTEPPLGSETADAAIKGKIQEIQGDIRRYRESMNNCLDELEEAAKGRKLQDDVASYLVAIADYQRDIEEAEKVQEKVRNLNLRGASIAFLHT